MDPAFTIGFLGSGNIAEALIRGLTGNNRTHRPQQIWAADPRLERLAELEIRYGIRTTTDNRALVNECQIVVLAVKPQVLQHVLDQVGDHIAGETLVISVVAGARIETIAAAIASRPHIVRAMPNMPCQVGEGATGLAPGPACPPAQVARATLIFDSVGLTVQVAESQLNAVTGLSGSGPAYMFVICDALADAGVDAGLSRVQAQQLAAQTMLGAARLLLDSGEHPGQLKDRVASPGGTSIAGLLALEQGGLRSALAAAVHAATERAHQLGAKERER